MFKLYSRPLDLALDIISASPRFSEKWALKDINLDINRGEVLGIVGSNGAGKSTLLSILAGTLDKTQGEIEISGRLASILELGTGFHPDFSGRENLITGGMCMGMSKSEVKSKLSDIISFSGLENSIDAPFRTYSSGMKARLTFSLAIHQDPDILIIDEALAAGDAVFVNKCMKRIKEICNSDTTVLFVSHSLEMVRMLCTRAIWIENGVLVSEGSVQAVTKAYERFVWEQSEQYLRSCETNASGMQTARELVENATSGTASSCQLESINFDRFGSGEVTIKSFSICDDQGNDRRMFTSGEHVNFHITYSGAIPEGYSLHAGCQIFTDKGVLVFTAGTLNTHKKGLPEDGTVTFSFPSFNLGANEYSLAPILSLRNENDTRWTDFHDKAYKIRIVSEQYDYAYIVEMPFHVTTELTSFETKNNDQSIS